MNDETRDAISEQVQTLGAQFENATEAVKVRDLSRLRKAIAIIEKVARILAVLLGAIEDAKLTKEVGGR